MLDYLGETKAARRIQRAGESLREKKTLTRDVCGTAGTSASPIGDAAMAGA